MRPARISTHGPAVWHRVPATTPHSIVYMYAAEGMRTTTFFSKYSAGSSLRRHGRRSRWYDATAEWVSLKRDSVGDNTVFSKLGGSSGEPVLETNQMDFDNESGFRTSFAIQLGPGSSLETTYLGLANWASDSVATSGENDLFSVYSDFGQSPPPSGFDDTDRASRQSIAYSSSFDTIELNYRRRWAGPNVRLQGSWLFVGVRYMQLKEDFQYQTVTDIGGSDTTIGTLNSMTGAQLGSDLWLCVIPGLSIGTEGRVGLYGNHASQRTTISVEQEGVQPYEAHVTEDSPAFLADSNVTVLWRVNQQWTFRAGYMFLWMDEVALATDNFNPQSPPIFGPGAPGQDPRIDNSSYVFYHGFTAGLEYLYELDSWVNEMVSYGPPAPQSPPRPPRARLVGEPDGQLRPNPLRDPHELDSWVNRW